MCPPGLEGELKIFTRAAQGNGQNLHDLDSPLKTRAGGEEGGGGGHGVLCAKSGGGEGGLEEGVYSYGEEQASICVGQY